MTLEELETNGISLSEHILNGYYKHQLSYELENGISLRSLCFQERDPITEVSHSAFHKHQ